MENFHKYPKIYTIGHFENKEIFSDVEDDIIIQEKIDGANFRFMIKSGKVIFGSRTQQITSDDGEDTNVAKNFKATCDHIRNNIKNYLGNISDYEGHIFYGESITAHTMQYDWVSIPRFIGFDIYNIYDSRFLEFTDVKNVFEDLGFEIIPLINICKAKDIKEINDDIVPVCKYPSRANPTQKAEGIVFKNYKKQIFAKYVRNEFKEANAETFGGNPKYNKIEGNDNDEVMFKFCTNARIDKIIFKLIDEGNKLEMKLMHLLPHRVYDDIIEECGKDILMSRWKVDFDNLRRNLISKRCLAVLKQVMANNALDTIDN
jgi:hypothetical protein